MDLKTFKFPDVTVADAAFPTFDTIPELLKEAISRGFHRNYNPYNELFSELFFNGGTVQFKPDVDPEYQNRVNEQFNKIYKKLGNIKKYLYLCQTF